MLIQTDNNSGQGSHLRNECGGSYMATIEQPSPGSHNMVIIKLLQSNEKLIQYQINDIEKYYKEKCNGKN